MTIQELQSVIAELPHDEFWQLVESLDELKNERWDEEIARDAKAGRFDEIMARGKQDIAEGRSRPI